MLIKSFNALGIESPTILLDKRKVLRNIDVMIAKADSNQTRLRPHFKTHQSAEVGQWFRQRGVDGITVSSIDMAEYFADSGWGDITIAFPVNPLQIHRIDQLAGRISTLNLLVESAEMVAFLAQNLTSQVHLWLKIDAGYHRTGLEWHDLAQIRLVAQAVIDAPNLFLGGLLTHSGHTYTAGSAKQVAIIYDEVLRRLAKIQDELRLVGINAAISVGDTPGCAILEELGPVDEIRPGNFVFFDLTQQQIGACGTDEIAVAVACPVVAKHADRGQLILYGGAVHLSKDSLKLADGRVIFGRIARLTENGWGPVIEDAAVVSLSQEHGIVSAGVELLEQIQVGDIVMILPVHSCLTVNLHRYYLTTDGDVIEKL